MHALMIRAAIMTMLLLVLSVAMIHVHVRNQGDTPRQLISNQPTRVESAVSPNAERPVMLPTIRVRISPEEMARIGRESVQGASATSVDYSEPGQSSRSIYRTLGPALPRVRLDMPYYSFGKTLARAHKD